MDSFRRKIGFSSLALALQGCTLGPDLKDTAATARDAVLAVRPQADLKGVRVQLFTPSMDLKALLKDDSSGFSLPELRRVIDENAPSFVRMSLLDSKDAEMLRQEFADLYRLDAAGVAIYSAGLILIAPDHAGSVETCAHELAHIGSARMGYFAGCLQKYFPRAGGRPDPAWVD